MRKKAVLFHLPELNMMKRLKSKQSISQARKKLLRIWQMHRQKNLKIIRLKRLKNQKIQKNKKILRII